MKSYGLMARMIGMGSGRMDHTRTGSNAEAVHLVALSSEGTSSYDQQGSQSSEDS